MPERPAKITVLLGRAEFVQLDAYCREKGFKKSTLIARLIREHLASEGFSVQTELFPEGESEDRHL